jgi:hypothetical protein
VSDADNESLYERTEVNLSDKFGQTEPMEEEIEYESTAGGPDKKPKKPELVTEGISTHDNASLQTDPVPYVRIRLDDVAIQSAELPRKMAEKWTQVELEEEDSTSTVSSSSSSSKGRIVTEPVELDPVYIPGIAASDEEFSSTSDDIEFI